MSKQLLYLGILFALCTHSAGVSAQNTWTTVASFAGGERERAVAFVIGNRAYVGTGLDTANACRKDFWEYDPATNSWTQKADLPGSQRRDAIAFSIGNRGYVGTGLNGFIAYTGSKKKDFYEYNPVTNTWTAKKDFEGNGGFGIYYASAFQTETKGYVVCGKLGSSWYTNECWEYDPIANDWIKKANFPGGVRYGVATFSCNGKGYVGCGADENYFLNDFWEFDPQTNVWTEKAPFPGSARFNAVGFSIDGRGFIGMGTDGGYQKDMYEYNPLTDTWMQKASLPGSERRSCVGFAIGDYGYIGSGKGPTGVKRNFFKYTPFFMVEETETDRLASTVCNNGGALPQIQIKGLHGQQADMTIYALNGAVVAHASLNDTEQIALAQFDLAKGLYVYEISAVNAQGERDFTSGKVSIQ